MKHPEYWGGLRDRYADPERPHTMLAIDGGGIRGLVALGILERMEALLATETKRGSSFRLCDYFDYMAGTSTGAIIAAALAVGMSVREIIALYQEAGASMFQKAKLLDRLKVFYTADPLKSLLQEKFGTSIDLFPPKDKRESEDRNSKRLKCLLLVVAHNVTTDSAWPISSNPEARYNDPARSDCNLKIPLWQLVRASTAAPIYFPPETLQWDPASPSKTFVFVDGGMTPYNNPAFILYRIATQEPYRLGWVTGERKLLLMSVGTGAAPRLGMTPSNSMSIIPATLIGLPGNLMYQISVEQDLVCRTVGRCVYGTVLDRENLDLMAREGHEELWMEERLGRPSLPLEQDLGRAFLYARYNADLTEGGLKAMGFDDFDAKAVQQMDAVDHTEDFLTIGRHVGLQVSREHFGMFLNPHP
ncbi:patatin-like phospholipase family protein [Nitrospira sp. Nam74]